MRTEFLRNNEQAARVLPQILKDYYREFGLEVPSVPERPKTHFPIIVIFGPPGGGKTETADRLARRFGCQVLHERPEENPYVADSYWQNDAEKSFRSQVTFALFKFQDYMKAWKISKEKPVIVEPSLKNDRHYAQTFFEEAKMTEDQFQKYCLIFSAMEAFLFSGDIGVSVIPDRETLGKRIAQRGRDYEKCFSPYFLKRMIELCRLEEEKWLKNNNCLQIGNLDYNGSGRIVLTRDFGLKMTSIFGNGGITAQDGTQILCPEGWENFRIGPLVPDQCRFKTKSI